MAVASVRKVKVPTWVNKGVVTEVAKVGLAIVAMVKGLLTPPSVKAILVPGVKTRSAVKPG